MKKHGKPAADKAWMGWIAARSLFESIELAKSTDADAIIEALEAWKVPAGDASYSYRKFDHQMLLRNLVGVGEAEDHRQVGLLRRQGDAAGEPGGPREGVRHARGNRLQDDASGREESGRPTMLDMILSQAVNGLVLGGLYVLIAIGLSIIFGMLGIVNFAHGAFFALGAYFALTLIEIFGWPAVCWRRSSSACIGMVVETLLIRRLYDKEPLLSLILTFALALLIEARSA